MCDLISRYIIELLVFYFLEYFVGLPINVGKCVGHPHISLFSSLVEGIVWSVSRIKIKVHIISAYGPEIQTKNLQLFFLFLLKTF